MKREKPGEKDARVRSMILIIQVERKDTLKIIDAANDLISAVEVSVKNLVNLPDSVALKEAETLTDFYLQGVDALLTAYEWQELHAQAGEVIATAVARYPDNMLLKQNLAALLIKQKKVEEALNIYREVLLKDPGNAFANRALGISLVDQGKYEEGIPYLLRVLESLPNDVKAMQGLAGAYFNLGQDEKGKVFLDRLKELGN